MERETWKNRRRQRGREIDREVYWQGSELGYSGELMPTRDGSSLALNVSWFVDDDLHQMQTPWGLTGRHVFFMRCSCRVWLCLGCVVLQTVRLTDLTSTWLNVKMARGFGDCSTWTRHNRPWAWCTLILPKDMCWRWIKDKLEWIQLLHILFQLHSSCGAIYAYCESASKNLNALNWLNWYCYFLHFWMSQFRFCLLHRQWTVCFHHGFNFTFI